MGITAGVQSEGTEGDRADRICLKKYNYYLLLLLLLSLDKKNLVVGYFVICRRPLIVLTMVYFWR